MRGSFWRSRAVCLTRISGTGFCQTFRTGWADGRRNGRWRCCAGRARKTSASFRRRAKTSFKSVTSYCVCRSGGLQSGSRSLFWRSGTTSGRSWRCRRSGRSWFCTRSYGSRRNFSRLGGGWNGSRSGTRGRRHWRATGFFTSGSHFSRIRRFRRGSARLFSPSFFAFLSRSLRGSRAFGYTARCFFSRV